VLHRIKNQETENKNWRNYREFINAVEDFVNNRIRWCDHVLRMNKDRSSKKVLNMKLWVKVIWTFKVGTYNKGPEIACADASWRNSQIC
jgi:hypothetical protein